LPLTIEPTGGDSLEAAAAAARDKLVEHGALLFRGWGLESLADFQAFRRDLLRWRTAVRLCRRCLPARRIGEQGLYSSTEYPPEMTLSLHNELSYADVWPSRLYFFCVEPAPSGGETSLADSRRILAALDPQVVDTFRARGIRYIRNLSPVKGSGYSWQEALETDDRIEAERSCARIGADFEWRPDGVLRISQVRPATAHHPHTGEEVWFNQADGFHPSALLPDVYAAALAEVGSEDRFRLNVTYGDGSPIALETLEHIRAVLRAHSVPHRWQRGDVVVLDNLLAAHGRLPFSGPRKIALAMT
jgi:alpha-ketoglutarate-dependent taurine dioxygenase